MIFSVIYKAWFIGLCSLDSIHYTAYLCIIDFTIRTTRKTGGLLTGYKPVVLGQRLKALAFTAFKPHYIQKKGDFIWQQRHRALRTQNGYANTT